ncbi:hypothetical protein VNO78_16517 [Psophocarpus tetragonolobus]|uniref:Polysaccharide biosynthesis domain-containing protein n=1 Tax=Psophocarpus tetragonolobus TaxID=3891 RepID=A0AAN9SFU9_PSOTE
MQPWLYKPFQPTHKKKHPLSPSSAAPRLLPLLAAIFAATILLLLLFRRVLIAPAGTDLCVSASAEPLSASEAAIAAEFEVTPLTLVTLLHYATAHAQPQQSKGEIRRSLEILQSIAPCNFLVFGLGHDSLMWDSFNPRGTTLFLEEDPKWTLSAIKRFPVLRAHTVRYTTRLTDARSLLSSYKQDCLSANLPTSHPLKSNWRCKLALSQLPNNVYDRDWDVIMIDGPRGYFDEAPGRMAVIYSVAMMARGRRKSGVTHVFLHDIDREVEKEYAKEFLCMKFRVGGIRKLWHFVIPPTVNASDISRGFC